MFMRMFGLAVIMAAALGLAACSDYGGPVTNAPPPTGLTGLPLMNSHYAP